MSQALVFIEGCEHGMFRGSGFKVKPFFFLSFPSAFCLQTCKNFVFTLIKFIINFVLVFKMINLSSGWEKKEWLRYYTLILQLCFDKQKPNPVQSFSLRLNSPGWCFGLAEMMFIFSHCSPHSAVLCTGSWKEVLAAAEQCWHITVCQHSPR